MRCCWALAIRMMMLAFVDIDGHAGDSASVIGEE